MMKLYRMKLKVYLKSAWNSLELIRLVSLMLIVNLRNRKNEFIAFYNTFLIIHWLFSTLKFISALRVNRNFAFLVSLIFHIVKDMISFLFVLFIVMIGYSHIFVFLSN